MEYKYFNIDGITKVNQFTDPTKLKNSELVELTNMVLDIEGNKAIRRGAFQKNLYGTVDTTGTINKLKSVKLNNVDYLLASIGGKLRKYDTQWADVPGITLNDKPKIISYSDNIYLTDGLDKPVITDLNNSSYLEITKPDVRFMDNWHLVGGELSPVSSYLYRLQYLTDVGEMSEPSLPFSHRLSDTYYWLSTDQTYRTLAFRLPASIDPRVVSIIIWRTQANKSVFYYHSTVDNKSQIFRDTKGDGGSVTSSLITGEQIRYIKLPQSVNDLIIHQDRLIFSGIKLISKTYIAPNEILNISNDFTDYFGRNYYKGVTWRLESIASAAADLYPGVYQYGITYIDKNGLESDMVISNSITIAGSSTPVYINIKFHNIPNMYLNNIASDDDIVKARIYRSFNYGAFYYHQELSDDYIDKGIGIDSTTTLPDPNYPDSSQYYTQETVTYESAILYSDIGKPGNMETTHIRQIYPDDGDKIIGIKDDETGIMIFKEYSICKLSTQGNPANWRIIKLVDKIGTDKYESIIKRGREYYFSQYNKVFIFSSNIDIPLSLPIHPSMKLYLNDFQDAIYSKVFNWYIMLTNYLGNSILFIYDEVIRSWYIFEFGQLIVFTAIEEIKSDGTIVMGIDGDIVEYRINFDLDYTDTTANSNSIKASLKSKVFQSPLNEYKIRLLKLFSKYKKALNYNIDQSLVGNNFSAVYTDSTGVDVVYNKLPTGRISNGTYQSHSHSIQYQISGEGLEEFSNMEIKYYLTK